MDTFNQEAVLVAAPVRTVRVNQPGTTTTASRPEDKDSPRATMVCDEFRATTAHDDVRSTVGQADVNCPAPYDSTVVTRTATFLPTARHKDQFAGPQVRRQINMITNDGDTSRPVMQFFAMDDRSYDNPPLVNAWIMERSRTALMVIDSYTNRLPFELCTRFKVLSAIDQLIIKDILSTSNHTMHSCGTMELVRQTSRAHFRGTKSRWVE